VEPNPYELILNVNALQDALINLDLTDLVRQTRALADDNSSAYAWLDSAGRIQIAESVREIDGLILFQVSEPNPEFSDQNYHIPGWVKELGLLEFHENLRSVLTDVAVPAIPASEEEI
jgi:hypothetical protein